MAQQQHRRVQLSASPLSALTNAVTSTRMFSLPPKHWAMLSTTISFGAGAPRGFPDGLVERHELDDAVAERGEDVLPAGAGNRLSRPSLVISTPEVAQIDT